MGDQPTAEIDSKRPEPTCTGCGGPLRVERALMTCDTDECPGNLCTRLSWRGPLIRPAEPLGDSDGGTDAGVHTTNPHEWGDDDA